ncbi:MAG TPA: hypothetical protein VFD92_13115 [Candidatus Binatia bacterium]|nr:hypothetical protein [Candidatus Binatia bacterium]
MKSNRGSWVASTAFTALVALTASARVALAGHIGTTAVPIGCATKIAVGPDNTGQTLTLDASDPILSGACPGNGLAVVNTGSGSLDRSFAVDCQTNQTRPITGGTGGVGISLHGPNLAAFNCYVSGFGHGIVAVGDGADIEDSQVQDAAGDGFVVKSNTSLRNSNLIGVTFTGNLAFNNGGWGFRLKANAISGGTGSFFNNVADGNGLGGFSVKGDGNALSGSEAFDNGGPGFAITSTSCCSGEFGHSFDTAIASLNKGPGIVYVARDDGSNCVGGTGLTCTGGTFFPVGFDTTPGGITAADNGGSCPPRSLPYLTAEGVCPIVLGKPCSESVLDRCP